MEFQNPGSLTIQMTNNNGFTLILYKMNSLIQISNLQLPM
jgi:hypothetical protein